jgi:hypothetical protein
MTKKPIIAGICCVLLSVFVTPAMAMTTDEAECPLADVKPEGELPKTAYHLVSTEGAAQNEAEAASFNLVVDQKVDVCKAKYNWDDTVTADVRNLVISEMAWVGGKLALAENLIDVDTLDAELDKASEIDWTAIKNSNADAEIFNRLIGILVNQGFDPDKDQTPFTMLGAYIGTANLVREAKIKLSI